MSSELTVLTQQENTLSVFSGESKFNQAMMMAASLAKSDLIPANYKGKPENCLIAIELSNRLALSPFLVMQNMHVIQGRPSWSSSFIISCINASGKFQGCLKFEIDEKKTKCRAYAIEKETGAKLVSPNITLEMAEKEGWLTKNGSKWRTMPELMLRYRAASFFGRLYCPEIMNGMLSVEEAKDIALPDEEEFIDVLAEPVEKEEVINEVEQPKLL